MKTSVLLVSLVVVTGSTSSMAEPKKGKVKPTTPTFVTGSIVPSAFVAKPMVQPAVKKVYCPKTGRLLN